MRSNDSYAWTAHYNFDRNYTANGLNQYTAAGSASFTYDANGNLTSDGSTTFTYDPENRLVTASGAKTAALRYDPLGRLYEVTSGANTTRMLYDGDALTAEYNGSGTLLRRYAHGTGAGDDPLVWYEGSTVSSTTRRYVYGDNQGSILLTTDASGTSLGINKYDEYGIPQSANIGRFQYTGQAWLAELGLYHYKARMYSPTLGRFLQTDPIGYGDGMNWYNYVGGDPVNGVDPSGKSGWDACKFEHCQTIYIGDGGSIWIAGKSGSSPDPENPGGYVANDWIKVMTIPRDTVFGIRDFFPNLQNVRLEVSDSARQNKGCTSAGSSIGSTIVDRVGDAHSSIFAAGAASASRAGNQGGAQAIGKAALPGAVLLGGLSQGIAAADDHAHGMSVGRSAAIHGTGFAGGLLGGFLLGEALEPFGGGIVGAIVAGTAGGYGGSKAGEAAGAAVATAAGVCR